MDVLLVALLLLLFPPALFIYGLHKRRRAAREHRSQTGANVLTAAGVVAMAAEAYALWELANTNFSKGRLLRIRGRARTARTKQGTGWAGRDSLLTAEDVLDLSTHERAIVAAAWLRAAQLEHASVAAFSQLSLRLLELGAPADLVARAHRAALDEILHAEMCFNVASVLNATELVPDVLPLAQRAEHSTPGELLGRLIRGSLLDGALGEGVAARVALRASERTEHPKLRPVLATIARDELAHAELAWETIESCLRVGGEGTQLALRRACGEQK